MEFPNFRARLGGATDANDARAETVAGLALLQLAARYLDAKGQAVRHVMSDTDALDRACATVANLPGVVLAPSSKGRDLAGDVETVLRAWDGSPEWEARPTRGVPGALVDLLEALQHYPGAAPELLCYGLTLEAAGAYDLATDVYMLVTVLGPLFDGRRLASEAFRHLGTCLGSRRRVSEAVAAYHSAIAAACELNDPTAELLARVGLARLDIDQEGYEEARVVLDDVIEIARRDGHRVALAHAMAECGVLASRAGGRDGELARRFWQESLAVEPDARRRARLLSELGRAR